MFATKLTVFSCSAFTAKSTPTAVFVALSKTGEGAASAVGGGHRAVFLGLVLYALFFHRAALRTIVRQSKSIPE